MEELFGYIKVTLPEPDGTRGQQRVLLSRNIALYCRFEFSICCPYCPGEDFEGLGVGVI